MCTSPVLDVIASCVQEACCLILSTADGGVAQSACRLLTPRVCALVQEEPLQQHANGRHSARPQTGEAPAQAGRSDSLMQGHAHASGARAQLLPEAAGSLSNADSVAQQLLDEPQEPFQSVKPRPRKKRGAVPNPVHLQADSIAAVREGSSSKLYFGADVSQTGLAPEDSSGSSAAGAAGEAVEPLRGRRGQGDGRGRGQGQGQVQPWPGTAVGAAAPPAGAPGARRTMRGPNAAAAGAAPAPAAVPAAAVAMSTLLSGMEDVPASKPKPKPRPKKGAGWSAEPPPPVPREMQQPRQEAAPASRSPEPSTAHASVPLHQQAGAAAADSDLNLDDFCCPITMVSSRCSP